MRLIRKHVQCRPGNPAVAQRLNQGRLIHYRAPRHVDQHPIGAQCLQHLLVDQPVGGSATGHSQHQEITALGQCQQRLVVGVCQLRLWPTARIAHLHAKGAGTPGNGLADRPHAKDAAPFAAQRGGQTKALCTPAPGSDEAVSHHHLPGDGQQQGHGGVGHAIVEHIRCVTDLDTPGAGCFQVDGVGTHTEADDGAQGR